MRLPVYGRLSLVLSFIACFILPVIGPLVRISPPAALGGSAVGGRSVLVGGRCKCLAEVVAYERFLPLDAMHTARS